MQLFSIGIDKLNIDGTQMLDSSGSPILAYDNSDVQNFAKAWTGFTRINHSRSNIENFEWESRNRIDLMIVTGMWQNFLDYA
jgi:uncharacterized protein (DUF1800 family)